MALDPLTETRSGGSVYDPVGRRVLRLGGGAGLSAGEYQSGGHVFDADGREVINAVGASASGALGKFGEMAVWGASYTQGTWEQQFLALASSIAGFTLRNNGKSGSKLIAGEGESVNMTGVAGSTATTVTAAQYGGYGQVMDDTTSELQARSAFSDTNAAITTIQPLQGNAPTTLVYGPNDRAQYGNTSGAAALYGQVLKLAINARRCGYAIGPNNRTFFTFGGAWVDVLGFSNLAGSWGRPSAGQARTSPIAGTVTFTLPTDIKDGETLQVYGATPFANVGTISATINAIAVTGSPFTGLQPMNSTHLAAFCHRIPLLASQAGQTCVLTYSTAGLYFGGIAFEPSLTDTSDGLPTPVFVANDLRLPDAGVATWYAANTWSGLPTDAGYTLFAASTIAACATFDRFVGVIDLDAAMTKTTSNFNANDVHPNGIGGSKMADAYLQALAAMSITSAEAVYSRGFQKRPYKTLTILPPTTAGLTWASMPLADTELAGVTSFRVPVDLAAFTEYRIIVNVLTVGGTNAKLYGKWAASTGGATFLSYDGSTSASPPPEAVAITATGRNTGAWYPFTHTARNTADLWLAVFGQCTVVASPVFGSIYLQLR